MKSRLLVWLGMLACVLVPMAHAVEIMHWERLPLQADLFAIYQLSWHSSIRPCQDALPPDDLHYINISRRQVWLTPECEIRPPIGASGRAEPPEEMRKPPLPGDPQ